jgi:formylglycine-generating enzyme required for sulfatase activity
MSGNVWEWTHSELKAYPYIAADGREDEQKYVIRVLRGGSFRDGSDRVRCAYRRLELPDQEHSGYGFRVVVSPILPS